MKKEIDAQYDANLIHLPRNMKLVDRANEEDEDEEKWGMNNKLKGFKRREMNKEEEQKSLALHT